MLGTRCLFRSCCLTASSMKQTSWRKARTPWTSGQSCCLLPHLFHRLLVYINHTVSLTYFLFLVSFCFLGHNCHRSHYGVLVSHTAPVIPGVVLYTSFMFPVPGHCFAPFLLLFHSVDMTATGRLWTSGQFCGRPPQIYALGCRMLEACQNQQVKFVL